MGKSNAHSKLIENKGKSFIFFSEELFSKNHGPFKTSSANPLQNCSIENFFFHTSVWVRQLYNIVLKMELLILLNVWDEYVKSLVISACFCITKRFDNFVSFN